jgi:hypothetical protein
MKKRPAARNNYPPHRSGVLSPLEAAPLFNKELYAVLERQDKLDREVYRIVYSEKGCPEPTKGKSKPR